MAADSFAWRQQRRAELRHATSALAGAEVACPACGARPLRQQLSLQWFTRPSMLHHEWPDECQFLSDIGMQLSIDIHK
jgi:hypothetical protein